MKKLIFSFFLLAVVLPATAQNGLFGIVRKNYFSMVPDPFDTTILIEQFDSATIRLGYVDPTVGFVSNVGTVAYTQGLNLTGAALNPYDSTFLCMTGNYLNLFHLGSGNMVSQIQTSNQIPSSNFDNYRFNNSDSTMYGLTWRFVLDTITMNTINEVYLAKMNTQTGVITQISPTSVSQGYALAGSAIDPYQMVFYFSIGSNLIGLDLYTGLVYSNVPIQVSNGIVFDNFTYSCADTALYGLIRQNYFSYEFDTILNTTVQVLDSSTVKLGRIDPATGIVTTISPISLTYGGYSLNAGAAIDPNTMTYYYGNGYNIIGVSLITGLMTSSVPYTFEEGMYFDIMRNFESCIDASAIRSNPTTVGVIDLTTDASIQVYPNPTNDNLFITSSLPMKTIEVYSMDGKLVMQLQNNTTQATLDLSSFSEGMYVVRITDVNNQMSIRKATKY